MDYKATAARLLERVGGRDNVKSVSFCVTRLRLSVKDPEKVQLEAIRGTPGVINVILSEDEYQIVIGAAAEKVYDAFVSDPDETGVKGLIMKILG